MHRAAAASGHCGLCSAASFAPVTQFPLLCAIRQVTGALQPGELCWAERQLPRVPQSLALGPRFLFLWLLLGPCRGSEGEGETVSHGLHSNSCLPGGALLQGH